MPKISDVICTQIKAKILNGDLIAGDKLPPERDLTDSFKCSRPAIREALRKLENDCYIAIVQGSGAIVNEVTSYPLEQSLQNVIRLKLVTSGHLIDIRNVCDTLSVIWAVERCTSYDLKSIRDILDEAKLHLDSIDKSVHFSREFHTRIALAAHNQLLHIISHIIWAVIHDRLLAQLKSLDSTTAEIICTQDFEQHDLLYKAIVSKDINKAREHSLTHIQFVTAQLD